MADLDDVGQKLKGKFQKFKGRLQQDNGDSIGGGIERLKGDINEKIADIKLNSHRRDY